MKVVHILVMHPGGSNLDILLTESQRPGEALKIHFNAECGYTPIGNEISTGLEALGQHQTEYWTLPQDCTFQPLPEIQAKLLRCDDFLLSAIWLDARQCQHLESETRRAYNTLLSLTRDSSMPHVVRTWNYLPQINRGDGDRENYKLFCAGRAAAYEENQISDSDFAAASALGTAATGAVFYQLSTATRGTHFENPRQTSAYRYPRQYGPRSPSFARATLATLGRRDALFISGTASVTGHKSLHAGDIKAQTRQTLENISLLLETASQRAARSISPNFLKVYLRHSEHREVAAALISAHYPGSTVLFVQADICRAELLVEIDGHCWL